MMIAGQPKPLHRAATDSHGDVPAPSSTAEQLAQQPAPAVEQPAVASNICDLDKKAMSDTLPPGWVDFEDEPVLYRCSPLCKGQAHVSRMSAPPLASRYVAAGHHAAIYAVLFICAACWLWGWLSFVLEGRMDDAETAFEILPLGILYGIVNILHWLNLI